MRGNSLSQGQKHKNNHAVVFLFLSFIHLELLSKTSTSLTDTSVVALKKKSPEWPLRVAVYLTQELAGTGLAP
jgi:hypothetical protein